MSIKSVKLKLIASHAVLILVSFALVAFFLDRRLELSWLPMDGIQKMSFEIRRTLLFDLFFACVFVLILVSTLTNRVLGPMNRMITSSRPFAAGDFSHRIIQPSKDQIGALASTLNKMAQDIENKIKEIETQRQEFRAIFNSMAEGVLVTDVAGRLVSVNSTLEKIFEVTEANAKGKNFLEIIRNNDIEEVIRRVLKTGAPIAKEINLVYPVQRIFEVNATPIFEHVSVNGCLVVIHDMTDMRKLETMRRDFVANVSHELKTPLTAIKGFTETLLEGAVDDKENNRHFLKIIQEHTERLESLINDLLVLSHLESKGLLLKKTDFNLRRQLEKIVLNNSVQLKKKNLEVRNELSADILVRADQDRIEQVLINFMDNAIKFNKENGWIKVYAEKGDHEVKIIVEDSGVGIPAKDIPRIFERFYRADKARSSELGGTGLGLSIVKHIVELHGGRVGVESTEGLGSKFRFTLPDKNALI